MHSCRACLEQLLQGFDMLPAEGKHVQALHLRAVREAQGPEAQTAFLSTFLSADGDVGTERGDSRLFTVETCHF